MVEIALMGRCVFSLSVSVDIYVTEETKSSLNAIFREKSRARCLIMNTIRYTEENNYFIPLSS